MRTAIVFLLLLTLTCCFLTGCGSKKDTDAKPPIKEFDRYTRYDKDLYLNFPRVYEMEIGEKSSKMTTRFSR